jgi:hypothetical protein
MMDFVSWSDWWDAWTAGVSHKASDKSTEKSQTLFLSWLTDDQRKEWEACRSFTVVGSLGGLYMIADEACYNITRDRDGEKFCLQLGPIGVAWPKYDIYLAQKLLIEIDEKSAMSRANARIRLNIGNGLGRPEW